MGSQKAAGLDHRPPLELVLDKLHQVTGTQATRQGDGWSSRCPTHEDNRESLTIGVGSGGRLLIHFAPKCVHGN